MIWRIWPEKYWLVFTDCWQTQFRRDDSWTVESRWIWRENAEDKFTETTSNEFRFRRITEATNSLRKPESQRQFFKKSTVQPVQIVSIYSTYFLK